MLHVSSSQLHHGDHASVLLCRFGLPYFLKARQLISRFPFGVLHPPELLGLLNKSAITKHRKMLTRRRKAKGDAVGLDGGTS